MAESGPPVVLVFAGNDPVAGAGIAADIQALTANGCYPAPVITALTVQDSVGVQRVDAVDPELVEQQARAVLDDLPVAAIKTGLLVNPEILARVARLAEAYRLPLIVDPVLGSGSGQSMTSGSLSRHYCEKLLPHTLLVTPNIFEARELAGANHSDEQAQYMINAGCQWVLLTGGHQSGEVLEHRLYNSGGLVRSFAQPRLPGEFHGSGCTLASACAAGIARQQPPEQAVASALVYTLRTLEKAFTLGKGQSLPNRLPDH